MDAQSVVLRFETHACLAELRPRRERHDGLRRSGDDAGEVGASRGDVVREVVGDLQAGPPRLHRHRAVEVLLAQRQGRPRRAHGEVAGLVAAEQMREDRRRIRLRVTEPGEGRVGSEQSDGPWAGHHGEALDARRVGAGEPPTTLLGEERQGGRDVLGALDAVLGERVAGPDLDADVGPVQTAERLLVGDVVAEEDRRGRAPAVAEDVERLPLVGDDDRQLDHRLTLGDLHAVPLRDAVAYGGQGTLAHLRLGVADVQRDARGLGLDGDVLTLRGDVAQLGDQPIEEFLGVVGQFRDESRVELRAVAADQLHLDGQAGEDGEVAQSPAGDDGGIGVVEPGERPQRAHRLRVGVGLLRVGHQRRHGAVVVRGDQQAGHPRDADEGAAQCQGEIGGAHRTESRAPRRSVAHRERARWALVSEAVDPVTTEFGSRDCFGEFSVNFGVVSP